MERKEFADAYQPDALIVAVGSSPLRPPVPGLDGDNGDTGIVVAVDEDAFGVGVRALNIAGATNYRAYTYADSKLTQGDAVWNITEETNILIDLAVRYPELFCSVAPMSGIMDNTAENLRALENIPVWCFVGSADNMVKPARSVPFMTALMERNPEARLTTIEGAGHGEVFTHAVTLDEYGVWDWLLSYSKGN